MKIIFLLLVSWLSLYAGMSEAKEIKIHDSIAKSLFNTTNVDTYTDSKALAKKISDFSSVLSLSAKDSASYMLLTQEDADTSSSAVVFVTSYQQLKRNKQAVGAFYWKKGRPTIIFVKQRLEQRSIDLPQKLHKYYEDEKCLYEICF